MFGFLFPLQSSKSVQNTLQYSSSPPLPLTLSSLDWIGNEAVVENVVCQGKQWRIRYQATTWSARCVQPGVEFLPQDIVYVIGRYGLTLFIQPKVPQESDFPLKLK